jgi:hypothetical protein
MTSDLMMRRVLCTVKLMVQDALDWRPRGHAENLLRDESVRIFFFNRLLLIKASTVLHVMRGIGSTGAVSK